METQSVPGGNNGKGGRILLIVGVIVIIALLAVIIVLLRNRGNDDTPAPQQADTGSTREVLVTEDNVQDVIAQMEEEAKVATGSYEVTMNTDWTFPSNKSTSPNAYVENSTANTNAVYFDVYRTDTEEIIYASPIMPVGSVLDEVTIDTDLAPGTYDAIITYHLVDEEYNDLSEVSMRMTVTIEN